MPMDVFCDDMCQPANAVPPELGSLNVTTTNLEEKNTSLGGGKDKNRGKATGGDDNESFVKKYVTYVPAAADFQSHARMHIRNATSPSLLCTMYLFLVCLSAPRTQCHTAQTFKRVTKTLSIPHPSIADAEILWSHLPRDMQVAHVEEQFETF